MRSRRRFINELQTTRETSHTVSSELLPAVPFRDFLHIRNDSANTVYVSAGSSAAVADATSLKLVSGAEILIKDPGVDRYQSIALVGNSDLTITTNEHRLYPMCEIQFANDDALARGVGVVTTTRSGVATYRHPVTDLLTSAAVDEPRFELNSAGRLSRLIEGPSVNLISDSENLSGWSQLAVTINDNVAIAPDGTLTADELVSNNSTGLQLVFQAPTMSATADISVFAKAANGIQFIQSSWNSGYGTDYANFDIVNGIVGDSAGNATIEVWPNGWFRCDIAGTGNAGAFNISWGPIDSNSAARQASFTGDGIKSVFLWGIGVEDLTFASSYIPSPGGSVARGADNLSIDSDNIPGPTENYSITAEVDSLGAGGVNKTFYTVEGEAFRVGRVEDLSTTIIFHGASAGTDKIPGSLISEVKKLAATFDTSQLEFFEDNVSQGVLSSFTAITGTKTSISIGKQGSGSYHFGHIRNFKIFNVKLTDEQVAEEAA